jgi:hypothetical protein
MHFPAFLMKIRRSGRNPIWSRRNPTLGAALAIPARNPTSRQISPDLARSPQISPDPPRSAQISPDPQKSIEIHRNPPKSAEIHRHCMPTADLFMCHVWQASSTRDHNVAARHYPWTMVFSAVLMHSCHSISFECIRRSMTIHGPWCSLAISRIAGNSSHDDLCYPTSRSDFDRIQSLHKGLYTTNFFVHDSGKRHNYAVCRFS